MSAPIFEQLITLLDSNSARYRVIEHESAGRSADVAKVRGTKIEQEQRRWCVTLRATALSSTCWQYCPPTVRRI